MKRFLVLILLMFANIALAADNPVACVGANCKVVVETRNGSNVKVTAAQFDGTGAVTLGSGAGGAGHTVNGLDGNPSSFSGSVTINASSAASQMSLRLGTYNTGDYSWIQSVQTSTANPKPLRFYSATVNAGNYNTAGFWTLGPSTGNAFHVVNGNLDVQMRAANQNSQFISTSGYSLVTTGNSGGGGTGGAWGTASAGFFSGVVNGDIVNYTAGGSMWFSANGSTTQGELTNGGIWKNNNGTWTVSSDKRLKKNIVTMEGALDRINALHPVTFDWIEDKPTNRPRAGFIAQEVEQTFPSMVKTSPHTYKKDGQEFSIKDAKHLDLGSEMFANLVQAIQELSAENKALKFRLTALEADRKYQSTESNQ